MNNINPQSINNHSRNLFLKASNLMPGGVNSPVRAWKNVQGSPIFIDHASGSYVWDVDNVKYLDYVLSWGPLILGHAHPEIIDTVMHTLTKGTSFGAPTKLENDLASLIIKAIPSIEMIRFVNSGTEATMSAIRLARAFTGKDKIIKFQGGYHGHVDSLLVDAGSGSLTYSVPTSDGIGKEIPNTTLTAKYNDISNIKELFTTHKNDIAAIIVEPIAANMGVVPGKKEFLQELRNITKNNDALLIFDEIVTGFRVSYHGAQHIYNIKPDITCLGKIIGGGFPIGAYGASKEIMEEVAPIGKMYQAGTLSGNPVAISAGLKTLQILDNKKIYQDIDSNTKKLVTEIRNLLNQQNIPNTINQVGSMFTLFFTENKVDDWETASQTNQKIFTQLFHAMISKNIYIPPSPFEANFLSTAHTIDDINQTIETIKRILQLDDLFK